MAIAKVEAKINGRTYGGWKEAEVKCSMKNLSGSFSLSVTDRWSGQATPWPIARGDEAQILVNGVPVITGFVDVVSRSIGPGERKISISGRDKTCDLIDCSVDMGMSQFTNLSLVEIAKRFCGVFGIGVKVEAPVGEKIPTAALQIGETFFDFLDKLARKRGVLLTTDGLGNLVIARPGTERAKTALVLGKNIISGDYIDDGSERFSIYKVKAQSNLGMAAAAAIGNEPLTDFVVQATAKDAGVRRYRPKVIQSEGSASIGDAMTRAQWEAKVRAAKGQPATVAVQGWTQGDGSIWKPNLTAKIEADWLGLNEERIISEVSYKLSATEGNTATLLLERKDAFIPEPEVKEPTTLGSEVRAAIR